MNAATFHVNLNFQAIENVSNMLNNMEDRLSVTQRAFEATAQRVEAMGESIKKAAKVAAAGVGVLSVGVGAMVVKTVEAGREYQNFLTTLSTTEGSAEKAREAMSWIDDFAARTPFQLNQVIDGFIRLKVNGIDATNGSLKAMGNAASAFNKPLSAAVEALADATRGENERLKEFGISASVKGQQVFFTYTKNGEQMVEAADRNSRAMIEKTLTGIFNSQYEGQMAKMALTWDGSLSNMQDTLSRFFRRIANSGFMETLTRDLNRVVSFLARPEIQQKLESYAELIGTRLTQAYVGVKSAAQQLWPILKNIALTVDNFIQSTGGYAQWAQWLTVAAVAAGGLTLGFQAVGVAVQSVWQVLAPLAGYVASILFVRRLANFTQAIWDSKGAVDVARITWQTWISGPIKESIATVQRLAGVLRSGVLRVAQAIVRPLARFGPWIARGALWAGRFVVAFAAANPVLASILAAATAIGIGGSILYNKWQPFRSLIDNIRNAIVDLVKRIPGVQGLVDKARNLGLLGGGGGGSPPPKRALGGSVLAHQLYEVNENRSRKEFFQPAVDGRILSGSDTHDALSGRNRYLAAIANMQTGGGGGNSQHVIKLHVTSEGQTMVKDITHSGNQNVVVDVSGLGMLR